MNIFGNWMSKINKEARAQIHGGVCALLWAIWHTY
jgi:hypothetical protein